MCSLFQQFVGRGKSLERVVEKGHGEALQRDTSVGFVCSVLSCCRC